MVERAGRTPRRAAAAGAAGASPSGRAKRVVSPRGASPRARAAPAPASPRAAAPAAKHAAHYEFGGPPGAAGICLGLPGVCYGLVRVCNAAGCLAPSQLPELPPAPAGPYASAAGFAAYGAWIALCVALHVILPGERKQGVLLADGTRLTYKLNGMRVFIVIAALVAGLTYGGVLDLSWVHDNFLARAQSTHSSRFTVTDAQSSRAQPLLTAGNAFAAAASAYLYASSFRRGKGKKGKLLAAGGDTGNALYDFFIGRELNPRIGGIDLKQFCELTPGLIGWLLLDLSFAWKQYVQTGGVSPAMALVCAFHGLYVFDALACEPAILTTMDITTDGFGFMLVFGDLVWVPFTYSLQARYLLEHPVALGAPAVVGILALQALGYTVFRGANSQKDAFRRNPNAPEVAHLRSLATKRGTRLIVSGWWGLARHVNYFGDWLMAWAWCLPCGFASPVPYFYVIYFGVLLAHRERRDEEACRAKYGDDWDKYTKLVPSRIIPYIY